MYFPAAAIPGSLVNPRFFSAFPDVAQAAMPPARLV
jgi:hypothetical protein